MSIAEPYVVVRIRQPLCSRDFGVSPCLAAGDKCFKTRATCSYPVAYELGTPLDLYYTTGAVAEQEIEGVDYAVPSLVSVTTAPTVLNLAGTSSDSGALGTRALCTITFLDHPHTDRVVDPYLSTRTYDPLRQGTYWGKWLARNAYRTGVLVTIYEGYAGQSLAEARHRDYFLDGSSELRAGKMVMRGKDLLAKAEERKAKAPPQSPGELVADIDAVATTFAATGAVEADYPASGKVRIGDEVIAYTGRSETAGVVTFTGATRASDQTVAKEHKAEARVQRCLEYTPQTVDLVVADLLTTYAGIDPAYLETAAWATEVASFLPYTVSALITEPTGVDTLIGEIQQQLLCHFFWCECNSTVKMRAAKRLTEAPPVLTEEEHLVADSVSLEDRPRERVTRVSYHYDLIQPRSPKSADDFRRSLILIDPDAEGPYKHGEASEKVIYSRWVTGSSLVESVCKSLLAKYKGTPRRLRFRLDAKDRQTYWTGATVTIMTRPDQTATGAYKGSRWTIISAEEVVPGQLVEYVAEDTTAYGIFQLIQGAGSPDYSGGGAGNKAYIGNALGLLSDGTQAAIIS